MSSSSTSRPRFPRTAVDLASKVAAHAESWYANIIWGKQIRDDDTLFEVMSLQVFQAGLGWNMILKKRDGFRAAFHNWNIPVVADFGVTDVENLKHDTRIIRNSLKIQAVVYNAQIILEIQGEYGSFSHWFYDILEGAAYPSLQKILRKHFKFMGPELSRMWLLASGRISRAEGESYKPQS
jgi:DNA-3-methyladenine glycosylase I